MLVFNLVSMVSPAEWVNVHPIWATWATLKRIVQGKIALGGHLKIGLVFEHLAGFFSPRQEHNI